MEPEDSFQKGNKYKTAFEVASEEWIWRVKDEPFTGLYDIHLDIYNKNKNIKQKKTLIW